MNYTRIRPRLIIPNLPKERPTFNMDSFGPERWQRQGFIRNSYFNGLGRFVPQLQRVTFKFCKIGGSNKGLRDFIEHDIVNFCRDNPGVAVYLKPRFKPTPIMISEYLNGTRHWLNIKDMERLHIKEWLDFHLTRSGQPIQKFLKTQHTDWPSIQGVWTPFLHVPPELNVSDFPVESRGRARQQFVSATQQLLRLQDQVHNLHILKEHKSSQE
jgi:large subunit ribosomal protein L43